MTQVMTDGNGLCQLVIKPKIFSYCAAYGLYVGNMLHSCAYVVVVNIKKYLSFMLKPAVGQRMQYSCIISCEGTSDVYGPFI